MRELKKKQATQVQETLFLYLVGFDKRLRTAQGSVPHGDTWIFGFSHEGRLQDGLRRIRRDRSRGFKYSG
jgi:hypothetical protein